MAAYSLLHHSSPTLLNLSFQRSDFGYLQSSTNTHLRSSKLKRSSIRCQSTSTEEPKMKRNLLDNASNLLTNLLSGGNLGSMPIAEGAVTDLFDRPLFFSLYDWFIEGVLADILEPIMGKGLIPADLETWKKRRRVIAPGFHALYLEAMVDMFSDCSGFDGGLTLDLHCNSFGPTALFQELRRQWAMGRGAEGSGQWVVPITLCCGSYAVSKSFCSYADKIMLWLICCGSYAVRKSCCR